MINVNNVSVRFKIPKNKVSGLKSYIVNSLKGNMNFEEFWPLKDITFSVRKGEVVGIVGKNGAGKSTLLKVISGILKPTTGSVDVAGTIVPMLELGSGFDYELTGRENIYLNGAILGYEKTYLNSKYDEILEFSELGHFIDIPIRNYSSGMLMRLAFSVATVVNPEILIVDEILAVGDESFQEKSRNRMIEMMNGGTTVLFVSHNFEQIKQLCNRAIYIEHGYTKLIDSPENVYSIYKENM